MGERAERERFAQAVADPFSDEGEFADELALVGALRSLGASGSPDAETRRRIKAGIVERLAPPGADGSPSGQHGHHGRRMVIGLVAAAVTFVVALGALGMVLSKDALPGDALYNVKLAGESAELGLTFGPQAKAEKHLEFATNRLGELGRLARSNANTAAYRTALTDFSTEVSAGVAELTGFATANGGAQQLDVLRNWAHAQADKLASAQAGVPPGAAGAFASAQALLSRIEQRTASLSQRLSCYQITSGTTDELGALPAQGVCEQAPPSVVPPPTTITPPSPGPQVTTPTQPAGSVVPSANAPSGLPLPTSAQAPPPGHGTTPPPVFPPPILPTPGPRPPVVPPTPKPPLISLPPLLPGLPPIIIP